jgi:hypothetical protein
MRHMIGRNRCTSAAGRFGMVRGKGSRRWEG